MNERDRRDLLRELAAKPGGVWVRCGGRSMEPTVMLGDRVRVQATRRVRRGEVVLFETGAGDGTYILHRVVFKLPGLPWFVHVGDGGRFDDPGVAHMSRMVGRAAELERRRPGWPLLASGLGAVWQRVRRRSWRSTPRRRSARRR